MDIEKIKKLRQSLHSCPEVSGQEKETKKRIQNWLREHTSLEIYPCGDGFYAAHREPKAEKGIALRADYDALALPDGGAAHLCGHDGHAAGLCGVAAALEGKTIEKNVFLLFQPAEETGQGAKSCCSIFEKEEITEIYGLHNLPGVPFGLVTTRSDTFACASKGITIRFVGKPTHAAYPENGISPALAVGKFLCAIPEFSSPDFYDGMTLCTVIGVNMGEKAFGAAAESAEVWLTLRGEYERDLKKLQERILQRAELLGKEYRLGFSWEEQDVFPSTENDKECAQKLLKACNGVLLKQPMRWSEDFGYYLQKGKGAFFGIGAGENYPALHTENYEYPDDLLSFAVDAFLKILTFD